MTGLVTLSMHYDVIGHRLIRDPTSKSAHILFNASFCYVAGCLHFWPFYVWKWFAQFSHIISSFFLFCLPDVSALIFLEDTEMHVFYERKGESWHFNAAWAAWFGQPNMSESSLSLEDDCMMEKDCMFLTSNYFKDIRESTVFLYYHIIKQYKGIKNSFICSV